MRLNEIVRSFINLTIRPKSSDSNISRREFILNILLVGLSFLTAFAFLVNVLFLILRPDIKDQESPFVTGFTVVFMVGLLVLSRKGYIQVVVCLFLTLLLILGIYSQYHWGADLSEGVLIIALTIVTAGVVASTRFAFIISFIATASMIAFTYMASKGMYTPDQSWKQHAAEFGDVIVNTVTLFLIALVSWLSSREIFKLLHRAQASEHALRLQRDQLEVLVEKRTRQLRLAQAEKLSQVYRFAELGRATSGLFHDLATPINIVSLNLNKLAGGKLSENITETEAALERARTGVNRLESFILAARKQIQNQEVLEKFSVTNEIDSALQFLQHRIKENRLTVTTDFTKNISLYGNPIKFDQLLTNLISNAIDAYDTIKRKENRKIVISLHENEGMTLLEITDFGIGIPHDKLAAIFEPLYTTKEWKKGTGIGLAICKDIVEKDFNATLSVTSDKESGTIFTVAIPQHMIKK